MDSRKTLSKDQSFVNHLREAFENGEQVNLLVDNEGIYRVSGQIQSTAGENSSYVIKMEDGVSIHVSNIIAINGLFRDDYSEC